MSRGAMARAPRRPPTVVTLRPLSRRLRSRSAFWTLFDEGDRVAVRGVFGVRCPDRQVAFIYQTFGSKRQRRRVGPSKATYSARNVWTHFLSEIEEVTWPRV